MVDRDQPEEGTCVDNMVDRDQPEEGTDDPHSRGTDAERSRESDPARAAESDPTRASESDTPLTPDSGSGRTHENAPTRTRGTETTGDSVVDLARQPVVKAWTTYLTLLFALVAVGFGLFGILSDAVDEGIVDTTGGGTGFDAAFEAAFSIPLTASPYLAILIAVFVGAALGWRLERDRSTAYVVAGIGTGVAAFVFWVLAALFGTIPLDTVAIDIGGLLVNAIFAGVVAGIVAIGGVWATRTRGPVVHTDSRRDVPRER
ncbi:hypothetical protein GS429_05480 [Natronorubrum sp. JWXQ-INN-674]|uniref:Uncharacterized protein n=1 Tax=Natronorubrum halalkaliphilum TaxID=2691917 RepID=A0A6B0VJ18_9EURY|nr:hypothetical protein [Natronorubrum halalkaliphilum]MXV61524.1 hypothetical protein [Natronorubrum halalkaliphilum]